MSTHVINPQHMTSDTIIEIMERKKEEIEKKNNTSWKEEEIWEIKASKKEKEIESLLRKLPRTYHGFANCVKHLHD